MFGRKLACSFCGKGDDEVAKLVAGPKVFICDRCAAEALRLMEDSTRTEAPSSNPRRGLVRRLITRFHPRTT